MSDDRHVDELKEMYVEGRIDLDEFERRVAEALDHTSRRPRRSTSTISGMVDHMAGSVDEAVGRTVDQEDIFDDE